MMKTSKDKLIDTIKTIGKVSGVHPEIIDEFILLINSTYETNYLQAIEDERARIVEVLESMKKTIGEEDYCDIAEDYGFNQAISDAQNIINNPTKDI